MTKPAELNSPQAALQWLLDGTDEGRPFFLGFAPPVSNTTYTPNQFFDVVLRHSSRGTARLVAYLVRKSLGWVDATGAPQEERIRVSYIDLIEHAGISRDMIKRSVDEAIRAGYINCVRPGRAKTRGKNTVSALYELRWDDSGEYITDPAKFKGFYALEGNRTYIPNEFFDVVVRHEKLSVIKVVGAVIRDTIGWTYRAGHRRQQVQLSFTTIQKRTLISDRHVLSDAVQLALKANYIVRVQEGYFDPRAGQTSEAATYGVKWLDKNLLQGISQKNPPEIFEAHRSEKPTGNGQKNPPEKRSEKPTDIEIKPKNKTSEKQQQQPARGAPLVAAVTQNCYRKLRSEGFNDKTALHLAGTYTAEQIQQQLAWISLRTPARNRLGMLRKAIEENWPCPTGNDEVKGSEKSTTAGRTFAQHFYAGHAGNGQNPTAEPSLNDIATAERYVNRLMELWPDESKVSLWGRTFGQFVRDRQGQKDRGIVSLVVALRSHGDAYYAAHRSRSEKRRQAAHDAARAAHEKKFTAAWVEYLRTRERAFRTTRATDYARFESERNQRRAEISSSRWKTLSATILETFDSEDTRLREFHEFFPEEVLDFWTWDRQLNQEAFNAEHVIV